MIETVRIENEGPDGMYLIVRNDGPLWILPGDEVAGIKFQVNDDVLAQLDRALQPWRDHMAEGERVRREYRAHRGAGYCTGWVDGRGPCTLTYGHAGPHSRRMILEEGEEV